MGTSVYPLLGKDENEQKSHSTIRYGYKNQEKFFFENKYGIIKLIPVPFYCHLYVLHPRHILNKPSSYNIIFWLNFSFGPCIYQVISIWS